MNEPLKPSHMPRPFSPCEKRLLLGFEEIQAKPQRFGGFISAPHTDRDLAGEGKWHDALYWAKGKNKGPGVLLFFAVVVWELFLDVLSGRCDFAWFCGGLTGFAPALSTSPARFQHPQHHQLALNQGLLGVWDGGRLLA